jgi:5-methyltetrahydrofolate--homocysteine methyltransferase
MGFRDVLAKELLFFDGAMGTMMQAAGLAPGEAPDIWSVTHPDTVRGLHAAYLDAGCNISLANTFGVTPTNSRTRGTRPPRWRRPQCSRGKKRLRAIRGAQRKLLRWL